MAEHEGDDISYRLRAALGALLWVQEPLYCVAPTDGILRESRPTQAESCSSIGSEISQPAASEWAPEYSGAGDDSGAARDACVQT